MFCIVHDVRLLNVMRGDLHGDHLLVSRCEIADRKMEGKSVSVEIQSNAARQEHGVQVALHFESCASVTSMALQDLMG